MNIGRLIETELNLAYQRGGWHEVERVKKALTEALAHPQFNLEVDADNELVGSIDINYIRPISLDRVTIQLIK